MPQKPQLVVDRDSIGFSQEFGSGTFIGTKPQESLMLQNKGLENLLITSVSMAGDSAFTINGPLKSELKGNERTYIQIIFAPTAEKNYSATITIVSNAENTPQKLVPVTGRGLKAGDAGQ
ncbi:MAG: hypothetical protein HYZ28_28120 [Myxococcales bacterium]|nr:hypothetical protein [Myxococcales bacterium]